MVFILLVRSQNNTDSPIGLLDLENIVIAFGISILSCLRAEIEFFWFWWSLSWISHFRLSSTTFPVVPLIRWTQKTSIYSLKFCFFVAYELRYKCSSGLSGLESAILNCYFRSGHTVILMGHLDLVSEDLPNDVSHAVFFMSKTKI